MSTSITPSLSQMIRSHSVRAAASAPAPQSPVTAPPAPTSFAQALAALKAAAQPAPATPTVFKAADIARAEPPKPEEGRLLRPGSLLNIRV